MANFKDLMRAFLYEEVDDDEDEYEEESGGTGDKSAGFTVTTETVSGNTGKIPVAKSNQSAEESSLSASQAAMQAAALEQQKLKEQLAQMQAAAAQEAQVNQNPSAADSQHSFGLSMDQVGRPDSVKEEQKPYRYDRRKLQTVRQKTVQTEYQAVLSPIFGNMEDEEKSFEAVHDAINLPKPEQASEITSIISPMYGSTALQSRAAKGKKEQAEPVPEYKPKRKKAAPSKDEKSGPKDLADYLTKEPIAIPRPAAKEDK